jgi:Na+/melibiose symporter-like transporter
MIILNPYVSNILSHCQLFNLLCRFTYLLVYLTRTQSIKLHSDEAAGVLLAGQVADAIATPLVGIFSDQSEGCARFGFGRRKV